MVSALGDQRSPHLYSTGTDSPLDALDLNDRPRAAHLTTETSRVRTPPPAHPPPVRTQATTAVGTGDAHDGMGAGRATGAERATDRRRQAQTAAEWGARRQQHSRRPGGRQRDQLGHRGGADRHRAAGHGDALTSQAKRGRSDRFPHASGRRHRTATVAAPATIPPRGRGQQVLKRGDGEAQRQEQGRRYKFKPPSNSRTAR